MTTENAQSSQMKFDNVASSNDQVKAFLSALQLSDSFLPIGSFTRSYGLESFIQEDVVTDVTELAEVLTSYITHQVGPCDMVAIHSAYNAAENQDFDRLAEVDQYFYSVQLNREFRENSIDSGKKLLDLIVETTNTENLDRLQDMVKNDVMMGNYPIVLGIVTYEMGLSPRDACLIHSHSFLTGLLGAAQRLMQLSHTDIQALIHDMKKIIKESWEMNKHKQIEDIQSFVPFVDIMSMEHENADLRLFRS